MAPIPEALRKEHSDKIEFLQNELNSLGIVESDHHIHSEPNDKVKEELKALAENIKDVYYKAYKTAYS